MTKLAVPKRETTPSLGREHGRREGLTGRFGERHAFLTRLHLDMIDQHTTAIGELTARIELSDSVSARLPSMVAGGGLAGIRET